jgi:DNA-directed RNA polymerase specialized sigma24 family protein
MPGGENSGEFIREGLGEGTMLIDEARTRELLYRICCRVTSDPALREDLIQEAMVHLWLLEARRPGQSRSWYLQNCKFHLQNYIAIGRSVDSLKRGRGRISFSSDCDEVDEFMSRPEFHEAAFAQLSARDIIAALSSRLTTFESAILLHLAEGLRAREIAVRLKVSHPTIIKHRRRIAALAVKLGIPPLPTYQRNQPVASAK